MTAFRPLPDPHSETWRGESPPAPGGPAPRGSLLIVGGSERLDKDLTILRTFIKLADAVPNRRDIVILTAATGHPEILGGEYERLFSRLGWPPRHLHLPNLSTAREAADPDTADLLRRAAAIYMTGGDQVALLDVLGGSAAEAGLRAAYTAGAVVGGTSAGATAMGDPMIARGGGSGELRRGMITIQHGLGLAGQPMFIDTHFGERGRFPRMCAAVGEDPPALGIGIDENTALLLHPGSRVVEVMGHGVVYFLNGQEVAPPTVSLGAPLPLTPLSLHILTSGARYDLTLRQPV